VAVTQNHLRFAVSCTKLLLPGYRRFLGPDEMRSRRIAEQNGKLAPVLPFRRVENHDHAADKQPRGSTDQGTPAEGSSPRSEPRSDP
jgi:hypothetical protein